MEYVIPIVVVVLLVAGFVTFMVLNATKKSGPVADGEGEGAPGIGPDETPLGDTAEHAGRQSSEGTTVAGQDGGEHGTDADGAHHARPGEGEGETRFEPERPASERLANRDD